MKHYNKYEIKAFWNHPDAKVIDKLDLEDHVKHTLQAVNKFGKVLLYPNKTSGLPDTVAEHIDYKPTYDDIIKALDLLTKLGYITPITKKPIKRGQKTIYYVLHYNVDINRIRKDIMSDEVGPLGF